MILCSKYTVKPSFNQKSFQVRLVTKFPDQECANSCATTDVKLLSPVIIVGLTKVNIGFSIPPKGKE